MTPPDGPADDGPAIDDLLGTLSDPVRREVVRYFETGAATTATLDDLVARVERRRPSVTGDPRTSLYQIHLPTLASRGWLAFDPEREVVTYRGHEDAARLLREVLDIFA